MLAISRTSSSSVSPKYQSSSSISASSGPPGLAKALGSSFTPHKPSSWHGLSLRSSQQSSDVVQSIIRGIRWWLVHLTLDVTATTTIPTTSRPLLLTWLSSFGFLCYHSPSLGHCNSRQGARSAYVLLSYLEACMYYLNISLLQYAYAHIHRPPSICGASVARAYTVANVSLTGFLCE